MRKDKHGLRCYCCGEAVGSRMVLVSMAKPADRVFVMIPGHAARADKPAIALRVREARRWS